MNDKCIAEFTAKGTRFQLIAHDDGRDGFTVFTRVLSDWDLDDVDSYYIKEHAFARFSYLVNRILIEEYHEYGKVQG